MKRYPILILLLCWIATVLAQEPPPVETHGQYASVIAFEADVPDVKALETKAVKILRSRSKLTLAEARAFLRDDQGNTNVLRCLDYIAIDALSKVTTAKFIAETIEYKVP